MKQEKKDDYSDIISLEHPVSKKQNFWKTSL